MNIVQLKDVCEIIAGQSPPSSSYNKNGDGLPFFQGKADFGIVHPITRVWCNQPKKIAEKGDILMSVRAPVGPTNICNQTSCIGRGLSAIRPGKEIDQQFLLFYLKKIELEISNKGRGSTFSAITQKDLKGIEIPLPPLEDQKRIVKILDQADTLRQNRQQAIELLDEYLKSVFLEMFGDPVTNPKGWEISKFGAIIDDIRYGSSEKSAINETSNSIPILRIPNILNGYVNYHDIKFQNLPEKEVEKLSLKIGDILFVRTNGNPEYIGRCAVFDDNKKCIFASYLIRARLRKDCQFNPFFVRYSLSIDSYRGKIRKESRTTAGNYNINTKGIKNFDLISPPKELQDKFIETLRGIEKIKLSMLDQAYELENQFQALMQMSFND